MKLIFLVLCLVAISTQQNSTSFNGTCPNFESCLNKKLNVLEEQVETYLLTSCKLNFAVYLVSRYLVLDSICRLSLQREQKVHSREHVSIAFSKPDWLSLLWIQLVSYKMLSFEWTLTLRFKPSQHQSKTCNCGPFHIHITESRRYRLDAMYDVRNLESD